MLRSSDDSLPEVKTAPGDALVLTQGGKERDGGKKSQIDNRCPPMHTCICVDIKMDYLKENSEEAFNKNNGEINDSKVN